MRPLLVFVLVLAGCGSLPKPSPCALYHMLRVGCELTPERCPFEGSP